MGAPNLKTYRTGYAPKHRKQEENLQRMVCHYLKIQYPNVIFRSDYASGLHLTMYQAKTHRSLQSGRSWPDMFIPEPRRGYSGLFLELKKQGTRLVLTTGPRKGHLTADPHIREQFLMLKELKSRGFYATFAIGFDEAVKIINWYFGKTEEHNEELPF